jgi:peptide/nickel transport system ATP-binding protein
VDGVSFEVGPHEILGLVGESGCGKTMTALSIIRLVPPPGRIVAGEIFLHGQNLLALDEEEMRRVRGGRIGMVFQEPLTSLNPVFAIGDQIAQGILAHEEVSRREAWERAVRMLELVNIPAAVQRVHDYPHQLSGGMRQRVMIALALASWPDLLIADEPTTALDVTIQAQILDLLLKIQQERGTAILLITHDLGIVAEVCHRVAVIYAGEIVESGSVEEIYANPLHPYTEGLLQCIPHPSRFGQDLRLIEGAPPDLIEPRAGCAFADRCPKVLSECRLARPELVEGGPGHWARCILVERRG